MKRAPVQFVAAALMFIAGCTAVPLANEQALESARSTYREVAADQEVQLRAPVELALAERALAQAEKSWRDRAPADLVAHQAYLAQQRARIAQNTAQYRKSEATVAVSGEQRNRVLLQAREQEAQNARLQARAAEQRAEQSGIEAQSRAQQFPTTASAAQERSAAAELTRDLRNLKSQIGGLKSQQTERGWVLTLRNDDLFDSGSSTLKPGARRAMDSLAEFMSRYPEREIAIEGFTDSTGTTEANRRLSESRAAAVKSALVARGIEPSRIDSRGYGPAFPVASNETPTGRQQNRRVEIVIDPS
jgi:outer membrane protein OmpA-like peptidoglycan-associated protein